MNVTVNVQRSISQILDRVVGERDVPATVIDREIGTEPPPPSGRHEVHLCLAVVVSAQHCNFTWQPPRGLRPNGRTSHEYVAQVQYSVLGPHNPPPVLLHQPVVVNWPIAVPNDVGVVEVRIANDPVVHQNSGSTSVSNALSMDSWLNAAPVVSRNSPMYSWLYWRSPIRASSSARNSGVIRGQSVATALIFIQPRGFVLRSYTEPLSHASQNQPHLPFGVLSARSRPPLTASMGLIAFTRVSVTIAASSTMMRATPEYPRMVESSRPGRLMMREPFSSSIVRAVSDSGAGSLEASSVNRPASFTSNRVVSTVSRGAFHSVL